MNGTAIPCVNDLLLPNTVSHKDEKPCTAGLMIPQYGTLKSKLPKLNTADAPPAPLRVIEAPALICGQPRGTGKWPLNSGWPLIIRGTS